MRGLLICGLFLIVLGGVSAASAAQSDCDPADLVNYAPGVGECLAIQTYLPDDVAAADTLVIVLHGDLSRGGGAEYFFPVAQQAAEHGAIGVAMMRLGYSGDGRTSTGPASRSENRDYIYTANEMDAIAEAVTALKAHYGVTQVAMIGHSGGAVMTGVILGRHPGLVQRALLLSCPCDIPTWRNKRGRKPLIRAESPHEYLDRIPGETIIRLVVGEGDTNTFPALSRDYAASAQELGLDAAFLPVPGASHSFNGTLSGSNAFREALRLVVTGQR